MRGQSGPPGNERSMIGLDVNTLFLVTIYVEAMLGLLLLFAWVQNSGIHAVAWWGCAHLLQAGSVCLFGMYGTVSDAISIDLANALLFTAFAVTRLLRNHFGDYVDIGFTAEMEEILDKISNGEKDWLVFLKEFYRGDKKHRGLEHLVEDKGQSIDYPVIEVGADPDSKLPVRVRIGRYGPFLQLGDQNDGGPRASLPEDLAPADLTIDKAIALLKAKAQGPKALGTDPATSQQVYVMHGRFGAYVQLGETPEDQIGRAHV